MNKKRILILTLTLVLAIMLSSCGQQASASWPGVTFDEEKAYLAFNQFVYSISLATGEKGWQFPAEDPVKNITFFAAPKLTPEGDLIVGSYTQGGASPLLYSLEAATGQEKWVFDQAGFHYIASPLITEKGIFAPNADGTLYNLDFSKNTLWTFETERPIWASPASDADCSCVFVASMDHKLYALNADNGSLLWKTPDLGGALAAQPTFGEDGTIYVGTSDNQMLALHADTGNTKWAFDTDGWVWSAAVYADGVVYFGDLEGNLYAVDAETGTARWKIENGGAILSQPLIKNDRLYYTTENATVYAVDLDSNPVWQRETSAAVYGPIQAAGDILLVALTDGNSPLVAFNENGDSIWKFVLNEEN